MKKIKLSLILLSAMIIFAGGMFLSSCDKTEVTSSSSLEKSEEAELVANIESYESLTVSDMPQLEVRDGMLYFANSEQYFKTIAIVSKMTDEELDKWEQELGFVSLRTVQNKALDELNTLETEEELYDFIKKKSDLFELTTDENGEQELNLRIDNGIYPTIINENKIYATIKNANKITETALITTELENLQELKNITNLKNINSKFKVIEYNSKETKTDKLRSMAVSAEKDERFCYRDRKVKLKHYLQWYYIQDGNEYDYKIFAHIETKGYAKSAACIYVPYKTRLTYNSVSCTVRYHINQISRYCSFSSQSRSNVYSLKDFRTITSGSTTSWTTLNNTISKTYLYYLNADGNASSTGVGSLWAELDYNR